MNRVAITAVSLKTPIGNTPDEAWNNLISARHGIAPITRFDTSNIEVKLAAENNGFKPEDYFDKKEIRRNDPYCLLALAAARDALAGEPLKALDPYRAGVIFGSGIGGIQTLENQHGTLTEKGPSRVSVFFIPMMISNMAAGAIAIEHGIKGCNYAPVTACATSAHAIGEGFRKIKYGELDACLVGGAESSITLLSVAGFNNMTALSRSTDPDRASIPFDAGRDGFVIGEGAAALLLENYDRAVARGAEIIAEVVGYGATCDAYHITSPAPDGEGAAMAMRLAMSEAAIAPADVGYINAHGTSTAVNDKYETTAIKTALGAEAAAKVAVSSTKSMTGHLLGAAGAAEAVITALTLKNGVIPPTAGYRDADPDCDLDYVPNTARTADIKYALTNSLGFGGHNCALCLKKA